MDKMAGTKSTMVGSCCTMGTSMMGRSTMGTMAGRSMTGTMVGKSTKSTMVDSCMTGTMAGTSTMGMMVGSCMTGTMVDSCTMGTMVGKSTTGMMADTSCTTSIRTSSFLALSFWIGPQRTIRWPKLGSKHQAFSFLVFRYFFRVSS